MRSVSAVFVALLLLPFLSAPPAAAQGSGSIEFGMDLGLRLTMYDEWELGFGTVEPDDAFSVEMPVSLIRLGVFVSDKVQVEPSIGLQLVSQGDNTAHTFQAGADMIVNLSTEKGKSTPFLSMGAGLVNIGLDQTTTQGNVRVGGGVKLPAGERWAVRLQGVAARAFETDDLPANWELSVRAGVSLFSR
jgi:hypothetical protein